MKTYALRRGTRWITAPHGDCRPGDPVPPVLALSDDHTLAWVSPTLDLAIERQQLLRAAWGWATEVQLFPSPSTDV